MSSIREVFGTEPKKNDDGTYSPSKAAMATAVPQKSGFDPVDFSPRYGGDQKVLMVCTEDSEVPCANGKVFKSGNHPGEMFLVVLHLERAGFTVDFATPTGKPVAVEMFAVPTKDDVVSGAMRDHEKQLRQPLALTQLAATLDTAGAASPYLAVYLPGGHGATQGVPFSADTKTVLKWFIDNDKHIITICHGPAGLLALSLDEDADRFPLAGYQITAFPDGAEKLLIAAGYLPGEMSYAFGQRLTDLGVEIINHLPTGSTHIDRKLISGDSPYAADDLGKMAAEELLKVRT